jgi:hypothetical protein
MKWLVASALAAMVFAGSRFTFGANEPAPERQFLLHMRVSEGDPLGSREAGTLKVLAEPNVVALAGHPFSVLSGGEITITDHDGTKIPQFFGLKVEGKAGAVDDGKVRLDLTLSNTTVREQTEQRVQIHTESMRTIATVRLGEVVKFHWGKADSDRQAWMELSVEEFKR